MELSGEKDGRGLSAEQAGLHCERRRRPRGRVTLHCHVACLRGAAVCLALFACLLVAPVSAEIDEGRQAGDPSPFLKVGGGECLAPASRQVRGRSRRDLSHPACRGRCSTTCLGYTYAPCEKVCTLHGDPSKLNNTEEADGWTTVNGGGKIETSSGRCGTNCYVRMGPCSAGVVASNGAALSHGPMPFNAMRTATCPTPFVGTLQLRCVLNGAIIEAGRCRSPCPPGMVKDGNFDVFYPQILHGLEVAAPCPEGANGAIVVSCLDGQASRMSGRCGYNCVTGSLKVGDAAVPYPFLVHEDMVDVKCPNGTAGMVRLQCVDSRIYIVHGLCQAECPASGFPLAVGSPSGFVTYGMVRHGLLNNTQNVSLECAPKSNFTGNITLRCHRGNVDIVGGRCRRHCRADKIGEGVKAVYHPKLQDLSKVTLKCYKGFIGELDIECDDGNVTLLKGECMMHCPSNTITSNGLHMIRPNMTHNSSTNITCPAGYTGVLTIDCFDGAISFEGFCGKNCPAGYVHSNTADVFHRALLSGSEDNFTCPVVPTPFVGSLLIRCFDGSIRHDYGWCGKPCPGGTITANGANVVYHALNHTQEDYFQCHSMFPGSLTFSGGVTISCWDGKFTADGRCEADCPGGKLRWMGAQVLYPNMLNEEISPVHCSPGPMYGTVMVRCSAGFGNIHSGTCGAPCESGKYSGALTSFTDTEHGDIGHNSKKWVLCPETLSGTVELLCQFGVVTAVNGSCGNRCRAQEVYTYGARFETPLMEHRATLKIDCQGDFNGMVTVSCDFGRLTTTSGCKAACPAGVLVLPSKAALTYPEMVNDQKISLECPSRFVGGTVAICNDSVVSVFSGGCYEHCDANWFNDPYQENTWETSWSVQHYEIRHDSLQIRDCPEGYSGRVTLYCWSGTVTLRDGDCFKDCEAGRLMIRPGVVTRFQYTPNGALGPRMPCTTGYDGTVRLGCNEGVMSLKEGGCNRTCPMSFIMTAPHGELGDAEEATIACPDMGTLDVRCDDGEVSVLSGHCINRCQPGTVTDDNGTVIQHGEIAHNETSSGACIGYTTGIVTLYCNDTVVSIQPRNDEKCFRHCRAGPVRTDDGTVIMAPETEHGNRNSAQCPGELVGIITVKCDDSILTIIDGSCGPNNCPSGVVFSNNAAIHHGEINDGWKAGPSLCTEPYTGDATLICRNGTTDVFEVTQQVPASIEDFENTSSDKSESLFVLCECCLAQGEPPAAPPIKGEDHGMYISWAIAGGVVGVVLSVLAGLYFLPRRMKVSRVFPEGEVTAPAPPNHPLVLALMDALTQDPDRKSVV